MANKKYTLEEALQMLRNKKGAGKSKSFKIHVEFDIEGEAGIYEATRIIAGIRMSQSLTIANIVANLSKPIELGGVEDKSYVETGLEENENF